MQRVAEDYARVRFPKRFPRFHFRAFSKEGKSRKGWPDAWIDVNGNLDGVEATAASGWSAVRRHIENDLKSARDRIPRLQGLIIVSGHPAVQPNAEELEALRKRFVNEVHIDPDRLEFVFGHGLVEELARPEFARTRIELLQIADAPLHFALIRARRNPDEGRLNSEFIPTQEDYEAKRVYRPRAADEVLALLKQSGCALVRGVGASGKTVLAWLLGLEAAEQRQPAYYIDFARYAQVTSEIANALIQDLHRFGHPDSLFVLDNCHLDEPVAKEVTLSWQQIYQSQRPKLLLLARELRTARGSPIDGLSIPTIPLRARQPEVLGVYRRLAGRHGDSGEPPLPPPHVLDDWVRTFGGDPQSEETTTDLIAFSAAVLRRMPYLMRHQWTLKAQDAIEEVREAYLANLPSGETQNLILLCACQEIEVALAEEALPDRHEALRKSMLQLGLVFRFQVGRSSIRVRYRLAHAALGSLILAAVGSPVDKSALRIEASLRNPHTGSVMVSRLAAVGKEHEARQVAYQMLGRPECLTDIGPPLSYVQNFFRQLNRLGISIPGDLGIALASTANREQLLKCALETPLGDLANFLSYASKTRELKNAYEVLTVELAKPNNRRVLAIAMETQSLDAIVCFLSSEVVHDLRTAITDIDLGRWVRTRRTEATPTLNAFVSFHRIVEQNGRPELSEAPAQRLIAGSTPIDWH